MLDVKITDLTTKGTPVDGDQIEIADSADSNNSKKLSLTNLFANYLKTKMNSLSAKSTPVDADIIEVGDSADSFNSKKTTIAELKAVIDTDTNSSGLYDNAIINGDFRVDQYGLIPVTGLTNSTYYIDRWEFFRGSVTANISKNTSSQPSELGNDFTNSLVVTASSSGTDFLTSVQYIEDYLGYAGKTATFTIYVKNNKSSNGDVHVEVSDGVSSASYTPVTVTNGTWEKLTISYAVNSAPTRLAIAIGFQTNAGGNTSITSGEYFEWTGVKCELGSTSSEYKPRHYGLEQEFSQRYSINFTNNGARWRAIEYDSNNLYFSIPCPTRLRTSPSILNNVEGTNWNIANTNGTGQTGFTLSVNRIDANNIYVIANKTSHGLTDGRLSAQSGGLHFDAEV